MHPDITCSSRRKVKCQAWFINPIIGRMHKTCISCRLRKLNAINVILDTVMNDLAIEVVKEISEYSKDDEDELIVAPGNRNRIIHMIIDYLGHDENIR